MADAMSRELLMKAFIATDAPRCGILRSETAEVYAEAWRQEPLWYATRDAQKTLRSASGGSS